MWSSTDKLYEFRDTDLVKIGEIGESFVGKEGLETGSDLIRQRRGKSFLNERNVQRPEETSLASGEAGMRSGVREG